MNRNEFISADVSRKIYDFVNMFPGAHFTRIREQLGLTGAKEGILASLQTHDLLIWEDGDHLYPMWCDPTACEFCDNCHKEDKTECLVRDFYEKRQRETQLNLFGDMK